MSGSTSAGGDGGPGELATPGGARTGTTGRTADMTIDQVADRPT